MKHPDWSRPHAQRAPAVNAASSSVGSLPAPLGAGMRAQAGGERELAGRELAGRWREAMAAERALGWVLWTALALVIVFVSG